MNKYKTGEYHIKCFDEYGTPKKKTKVFVNHTSAYAYCLEFKKKHPTRSIIMYRLLFNSVDGKRKG